MSYRNIGVHEEIRKIYIWLPLLSELSRTLRGVDIPSGEMTFDMEIFNSLLIGATCKRKNLLPLGSFL